MKRSRRTTRLFFSNMPEAGQIALNADEAHYLATVLRLRVGDAVTAFNGQGEEWACRVLGLTRRAGLLEVGSALEPIPESPLNLTLVQAVTKSESMDTIIQKATELGVSRICPVITEFSVVRLNSERTQKRLAHWNRIARSACEQSGRHQTPDIAAPTDLAEYFESAAQAQAIITLDPRAPKSLTDLPKTMQSITAVVGPEGGFGPDDESILAETKCIRVSLGQRILRAETAAIAICAIAQHRWGDLREG